MIAKPNPLPFDAPLKIITETKRFKPVNQCIYCGKRSNKLELEHILPFGIAANAMLLPRSSCRPCAAITGQVEQACLRHLWWPFRTRIGAPSGSRTRPETFKLRRVRLENGKPILSGISDVDSKEYPLFYLALLLPKPGILAARSPTTNFEGTFWATYCVEEMQRYCTDNEGMEVGPINPNTFARMLAKIAYSYTVAVKGYGSFSPLLLDLILGRTETANYWVGGDEELPPPSQDPLLHDVYGRYCTVDNRKTYYVVTIQLFAFLQSPLYHVVVAEMDRPNQNVPIN